MWKQKQIAWRYMSAFILIVTCWARLSAFNWALDFVSEAELTELAFAAASSCCLRN